MRLHPRHIEGSVAIERATDLEAGHGVDIWRIQLDAGATWPANAEAVLSTEEIRKAALMASAVGRRFVAARGSLRRILAAYMSIDPARVVFEAGVHGKPAVVGGPQFSLTHSEGLSLCAVSSDRPVGIDLSHIRPVPEAAAIAARYFSPSERARYLELARLEPERAFFVIWTRKEALIKAIGAGFSDEEAISREPDLERWRVHELPGLVGCVAALAVANGQLDRAARWIPHRDGSGNQRERK